MRVYIRKWYPLDYVHGDQKSPLIDEMANSKTLIRLRLNSGQMLANILYHQGEFRLTILHRKDECLLAGIVEKPSIQEWQPM